MRKKLVIGLISGTSADGIDAALTAFDSIEEKPQPELIDFETTPYPVTLRRRINEVSQPGLGGAREVCSLGFEIGRMFATAAFNVCRKARVEPEAVSLIGSHGQTIKHLPPEYVPLPKDKRRIRVKGSSLQIGNPSVIAYDTGITTIADFRAADLAAGGEGAPLLPYLHYRLYGDPESAVVVQNIGGIGNLTIIPPGASVDEVMAFDTGPGNVMMDLVSKRYWGKDYDNGGKLGAQGKLLEKVLKRLLAHPFLDRRPPKSVDKEAFAESCLDKAIKGMEGLDPADILYTVTRFTAETVLLALSKHVFPYYDSTRIYICGGGSFNDLLMDMLNKEIKEQTGLEITRGGPLPPGTVEAVGFALLAYETWAGRPGNLPRVTGAEKSTILGVVAPGRNYRNLVLDRQ
ncbi:MAG: anhydro-N-acetylmuramic acid kinase [bacterium]